jgi:hypothetical protein
MRQNASDRRDGGALTAVLACISVLACTPGRLPVLGSALDPIAFTEGVRFREAPVIHWLLCASG